ncbi:MAG: peptidoglycan editing factor PgeF [Clostridia bacterium]|nr:peptidoglycan editing factor PgeF [Clostridia bacterium]
MLNDLILFENESVFAAFTTRNCQGPQRREELAAQAALRGSAALRLSLVHGKEIVNVTAHDLVRACDGILDYDDVDGAVTNEPGIILTTGHADCLPVYLYDPIHHAIGLAHAGWKGTLANIAQALVQAMMQHFASEPIKMKAYIGPGIGACCFEVGREVSDAFSDAYAWALEYTLAKENGQFNLDIKNINKRQLEICGLEDITISSLCTKCREDLFFSYRRNKEKGRMLAYIYLKGDNK